MHLGSPVADPDRPISRVVGRRFVSKSVASSIPAVLDLLGLGYEQ